MRFRFILIGSSQALVGRVDVGSSFELAALMSTARFVPLETEDNDTGEVRIALIPVVRIQVILEE